MEGIFGVYKPGGPTSNDVLNQIRKLVGTKKVGHAGTLDPLAQGILVVGIGRKATKQLSWVVKKEKEYLARIRLGMNSSTDDEEGQKEKIKVSKTPNKPEIEKVLKNFKGVIKQRPPLFSAVKIRGREAYKFARRGEKIKLIPRKVEIKKIEVIKYHWPYLYLKVVTGPGVYIRSLARDIGEKLKTGGYLNALERTRVGDFTKERAVTVEQLKNLSRFLDADSYL